MPKTDDFTAIIIPKKPVILLLDTGGKGPGGSQYYKKYLDAIKNAIERVSAYTANKSDVEVVYHLITYSSLANVSTTSFCDYGEVKKHLDDISIGGLRDFGQGILRVNECLNEYYASIEEGDYCCPHYPPSIIVLANGDPTDDVESAIKNIQNSGWYKDSHWFGVFSGDCTQYMLETGFFGDFTWPYPLPVEELSDWDNIDEPIEKVFITAALSGGWRTGYIHWTD